MLLNRQKDLLSYLYLAGRVKSKTVLMKSLFLLCNEELHENVYDFFPYFYGPYSIYLEKVDIKSLVNKGLISDYPYSVLNNNAARNVFNSLRDDRKKALRNIVEHYGAMSATKIKKYVYSKFPYFAIKNEESEMQYRLLNPAYDLSLQTPGIFTIGYEGKTVDAFLNSLVVNNIKTLVDIRNNPRSMKYGFYGPTLKHYLDKLGIDYAWFPELGIESSYRKKLKNDSDYKLLFKKYEAKLLPKHVDSLRKLYSLLEKDKRIVLMCFEAEHKHCHRQITGKKLAEIGDNKYGVIHL